MQDSGPIRTCFLVSVGNEYVFNLLRVSQGLNTVINDFKEKNHGLIMLRPSAEILRSVQSLSEEIIRVAYTDAELVAILKEFSMSNRVLEFNAELIDVTNVKSDSQPRDEHNSTKL